MCCKMNKISICTTISQEYKELAEKSGIKLSDALARGIQEMTSGQQKALEFEEQRLKISKLTQLVAELQHRIWDIEEKVSNGCQK